MREKPALHNIQSIVIFTLDSMYSGVGIYRYLEEFNGKIKLICVSDRYGPKYGSFFRQLVRNLKNSGISFVHYLAYHFLYFYPAVYVSDYLNRILGRSGRVFSVWQLKRKYGVPVLKTNEPNNVDVVNKIKSFAPDLIITTYFDHIIRKELINLPKYGIINVHTALLPDYKGPFPALWPRIKREKDVGVTVHYINNERLDVGPILAQKKIHVIPNESVLGLDCRLVRQGVELAIEVVHDIDAGIAKGVAQEKHGRGKYYSYPKKEELIGRNFRLAKMRDFLKQFI